jgi:hypothetical protein
MIGCLIMLAAIATTAGVYVCLGAGFVFWYLCWCLVCMCIGTWYEMARPGELPPLWLQCVIISGGLFAALGTLLLSLKGMVRK